MGSVLANKYLMLLLKEGNFARFSVFTSVAVPQLNSLRLGILSCCISVISPGFSDVWRQFLIGQADPNSLLVTEEFFSMKHKGGVYIYIYKNYIIHIFLLTPSPLAQI